MTVGRAAMSGVMVYVIVAGMVAVSNGITQAVSGRTLTSYLAEQWGKLSMFGGVN